MLGGDQRDVPRSVVTRTLQKYAFEITRAPAGMAKEFVVSPTPRATIVAALKAAIRETSTS